MTPRLELKSVTRRFDGQPVVDGIDLTLRAGEVACLLGPSGCGKSTTLRLAAGVDSPDGGEVLIDGEVVADGRRNLPPEHRSIGLMFQDFALFPHLDVARNVAFGLSGGKAEQMARVTELLGKVGLAGYEGKFPHQLSGGEQQRVALARALAPRPAIMLMDEPFSGLDKRLRDGIRDETLDILREEGTAVLLVTHEPDEAMRMADKIALMRNGRIVQVGNPYSVYTKPVDKEAAAFFSDINVVHGVVASGSAETPFGQFLTPGLVDGADVEIIFRPQHLRLDFPRKGAPVRPTVEHGVPAMGTVARVRFVGNQSIVELEMEADQSIVRAIIPGVFMPPEGTPLVLSLRRDICHVFPCAVQTRVDDPWLHQAAE
ncbi:ABC transporter ATP-binding protein [Pontivivens insulae]|uniref:Fe(3+) ions import ATP-binding protein FbpC n=1 Tax=Pontivivens insulae TaxID=1639689 RepID=A0A2R8AA52_9RHOB|nr:ABC transporter ATP-binding protein [Pontivivens insulae]RED12847.1 iron(III) transport system ATP-binding protein [Pontivivens insulae]SPF28938.1 Fe(3+) ions import ATP-binding protein FbpC [Pontivivens insulae]